MSICDLRIAIKSDRFLTFVAQFHITKMCHLKKLRYKLIGQALSLLLILGACEEHTKEDSTDFSNCMFEEPTAVFDPSLSFVEEHVFILHPSEAIEQVVFENGLELELTQSGCNEIVQVFQFKLYGNFPDLATQVWLEKAGQYFLYMGTLDELYFPLYKWGEAMLENAATVKLNQTFQLNETFSIKVNRKKYEHHALLSVTLKMRA